MGKQKGLLAMLRAAENNLFNRFGPCTARLTEEIFSPLIAWRGGAQGEYRQLIAKETRMHFLGL